MAGAATAGVQLNGGGGGGGGGGATPNSNLNASELNSFRIGAVIDRLSLHFRSPLRNDTAEFLNLYLSLARGIDFAIANHEVPSRSQDLPSLVKQVCKDQDDPHHLAAIMVLMISVKNACQCGWFSDKDCEDLRDLANEIASNFGIVPNNDELSSSSSVLSTIMSRFYPRMKMGLMLTFVEAKPGFEAYVSDFQISKNLKSSPGDKIRLFVVQTDNIETSSCLITPPRVNFLLNGKAVERRNNLFMDTTPQAPTIVTPLLKYGSNLLQAIGDFNGNYIIAVAFMSEMPNPDKNALQDYEHAPATVDSDSEIIEGASRISLNCPISFKRIKTPVKGLSCRHIQCVDFDNYVDMNSRAPSWRCPHCNQHVCFTDIRMDQTMVKVLKEVGPDVSDIIFSPDGSWKAVKENNDATQKPEDNKTSGTTTTTSTTITSQDNNKSPQPETDIMDLTQTDDPVDSTTTHVGPHETADKKNSPAPHQKTGNTNLANNAPHLHDEFWSGLLMSTFTQGGSSSSNRQVEAFAATATTNALTATTNTETSLQQFQYGNSTAVTNEYGRFPCLPRNVTRTANAVQALPAQAASTPPSVTQQASRNSVNAFIQNVGVSQGLPYTTNSTVRVNPHQVSQMSAPPLYQRPGVQQNRPFQSVQPPHQRHTPSPPLTHHPRVPQPSGSFSQPQNLTHQPSRTFHHTTGVPVSTQANLIAAANRSIHMAVDPQWVAPSYPVMNPGVIDQRGNFGITPPPPVTGTTDAAYDHSSDETNWRPAGRMRGALSGQALTDALNHYIVRPTNQQQSQPVGPTNNGPQGFMGGPGGPPPGYHSRPGGSDGMH